MVNLPSRRPSLLSRTPPLYFFPRRAKLLDGCLFLRKTKPFIGLFSFIQRCLQCVCRYFCYSHGLAFTSQPKNSPFFKDEYNTLVVPPMFLRALFCSELISAVTGLPAPAYSPARLDFFRELPWRQSSKVKRFFNLAHNNKVFLIRQPVNWLTFSHSLLKIRVSFFNSARFDQEQRWLF